MLNGKFLSLYQNIKVLPGTQETYSVGLRLFQSQHYPDLASTDDEREHRHVWMAKVNEAYKQQDEGALKTLLMDWEASPESVEGTGIPSDLVRVIRHIAHVRRRIDSLDPMVDTLKTGQLYTLYTRHQATLLTGRSLLEEMAAALDLRIGEAKRELMDLEPDTP